MGRPDDKGADAVHELNSIEDCRGGAGNTRGRVLLVERWDNLERIGRGRQHI